MAMASLPDHMIEHIITWLPVQSILRFRSVSKSWLNLTRHPHFTTQHRTHSPHRRDATHLLLTYGREIHLDHKVQTLLTATHDGAAPSPLHLPPNILEHGPFTLSCCLGLISMHPREPEPEPETFVYNPSTREAQSIPFNADAFTHYEAVRNYIGFEPVSKQYKIMILGTWNKHSDRSQHCEIITLGTQDWRHVAANGDLPRDADDSTYLNGALHWLTNDSQRIKVFDLESETFCRTILGPKKPVQESQRIELCAVHGRLTLVGSGAYRRKARFELWTLEDYYGGGGVWVEGRIGFSVPRCLLSKADIGCSRLRLVGVKNNDEIVIISSSSKPRAFSYDMRAKKGRKISARGEEEDKLENIMLYTESL